METRTRIAIILTLLTGGFAGGSRPAVNLFSDATPRAIAVAPQPSAAPMATQPKISTPRTLKLKLTLDIPADLKVVQAQRVVKNQILSERASARERLNAQRQLLLLRLEQLKPTSPALSSTTRIAPALSYAEERANIATARLEVEQARAARNRFLASSPWTDYAREQFNMRSEQEKLAELEAHLQHKQANLNLAIARLQSAQEERQQATYKEQARQDTSLEQAQIQTQLQAIEKEIARLGVVRSPYDGVIKKIKWAGQNNQELLAELTIAVQDNTPTVLAATLSRSNGASRRSIATAEFSPRTAQPSPRTATAELSYKTPTALPPTPTQYSTKALSIPNERLQPVWQVLSARDGDTIQVRLKQKIERVRLACIDAPELNQPLGQAARDSLQQQIKQHGDRVALRIVDTDRYGRQIAEVFAGGKLLQEKQVSTGMAYVYQRYLHDCPNAAAVRRAEALARKTRAGVWNGNYETPWNYRNRIRTR